MPPNASTTPPSSPDPWQHIPPGFRRFGLTCWLFIGVILSAAVFFWAFGTISNLVTPFVIALVFAALFHSVVDSLERRRIPRLVGSLLVVVLLLAMVSIVLWVTVVGIFSQSGEMVVQVRKGVDLLAERGATLDLPPGLVNTLGERAMNEIPRLASGVASSFTSSLSGVFAVFMSVFSAVFLLFYLMYDWHGVVRWASANLGVPRALGEALVEDATGAIRIYFNALTLSSILVSLCVGGAMAAMGLPLAVQIGLVTLITSYVPYLGAIFAGAFAVLVALGSGGLQSAVVVLAVVLLMQNVVQTIIQNRMASDRLNLHPILTFTSVIAGGILFGVLGAALANPVAALILAARKRLLEQREVE